MMKAGLAGLLTILVPRPFRPPTFDLRLIFTEPLPLIPRINRRDDVPLPQTSILKWAAKEQRFMSAKWNWLIDNSVIRSVIESAVFAVWIAAAVGILFAARY
jgi:hypothetical protein